MNTSVKREREHLVLYVDGDFYCTCDSWREINEEIDSIKNSCGDGHTVGGE